MRLELSMNWDTNGVVCYNLDNDSSYEIPYESLSTHFHKFSDRAMTELRFQLENSKTPIIDLDERSVMIEEPEEANPVHQDIQDILERQSLVTRLPSDGLREDANAIILNSDKFSVESPFTPEGEVPGLIKR